MKNKPLLMALRRLADELDKKVTEEAKENFKNIK